MFFPSVEGYINLKLMKKSYFQA